MVQPIRTTNVNAWFGDGVYFWYDIDDAHVWGHGSKKGTGEYEIYSAKIDCENILDTVFNEEHYRTWLDTLERAFEQLANNNNAVTLKDLNEWFELNEIYEDVDGIMFQDISLRQQNPIGGQMFHYKKRIQIAIYNDQIISNFSFTLENVC